MHNCAAYERSSCAVWRTCWRCRWSPRDPNTTSPGIESRSKIVQSRKCVLNLSVLFLDASSISVPPVFLHGALDLQRWASWVISHRQWDISSTCLFRPELSGKPYLFGVGMSRQRYPTTAVTFGGYSGRCLSLTARKTSANSTGTGSTMLQKLVRPTWTNPWSETGPIPLNVNFPVQIHAAYGIFCTWK